MRAIVWFWVVALAVACQVCRAEEPRDTRRTSAVLREVSPPVPIIREIVDGVVREKDAIILTPEEIERIKKSSARARRAAITPYPNSFVARPRSRAIMIEPDSVQEPRMFRLAAGVISSLVFSDYSGNPWLVSQVSYDHSLFSDGTDEKGGDQQRAASNVVKISPLQPYAFGNIVVELEGLPSPITFMLSTGESDETDVQITARVAGRNPGAKAQVIQMDALPDHDSMMGYFLDGVPPQGSQRLTVSGSAGEAWLLGGAIYLRTRLAVLSPAFTNHVGSTDGLHVYKFATLVPNVLVSSRGRATTMFLSGY